MDDVERKAELLENTAVKMALAWASLESAVRARYAWREIKAAELAAYARAAAMVREETGAHEEEEPKAGEHDCGECRVYRTLVRWSRGL